MRLRFAGITHYLVRGPCNYRGIIRTRGRRTRSKHLSLKDSLALTKFLNIVFPWITSPVGTLQFLGAICFARALGLRHLLDTSVFEVHVSELEGRVCNGGTKEFGRLSSSIRVYVRTLYRTRTLHNIFGLAIYLHMGCLVLHEAFLLMTNISKRLPPMCWNS